MGSFVREMRRSVPRGRVISLSSLLNFNHGAGSANASEWVRVALTFAEHRGRNGNQPLPFVGESKTLFRNDTVRAMGEP